MFRRKRRSTVSYCVHVDLKIRGKGILKFKKNVSDKKEQQQCDS